MIGLRKPLNFSRFSRADVQFVHVFAFKMSTGVLNTNLGNAPGAGKNYLIAFDSHARTLTAQLFGENLSNFQSAGRS